ncbi:MAG: sulfatase [Sedimentisphaerales bacterium]|nr:sulfatase [Sedimentisphaerales bacterium]
MSKKETLQNQPKNPNRRELIKSGLYYGLAAGLPATLILKGFSKSQTSKRPNVVLISIDTTRNDHCNILHKYKRDTTPNLRQCAQNGAYFRMAYAPTASTMPSHATMFTSLYPVNHGVLKNGLKLLPHNYTLAEHLSAHKYQTAAVVSLFLLDTKFGFAKGFSFYDDKYILSKASCKWRSWEGHDVEGGFDQRADDTTTKAIDWLQNKRDPDNPFFLFLHYYDPHFPYVPPRKRLPPLKPGENYSGPSDELIHRYDGEVAYVDYELGLLFNKLNEMGLEENTLVIITSDHGEGLFQHGHMAHAIFIYEESVRVPLIFRWPGHIVQNQVFNAPVNLISLAPTILDLIGVERDGCPFEGQSLAPTLRGESKLDINRPVFLYREHYKGAFKNVFHKFHVNGVEKVARTNKIWLKGDKFGIRMRNWKYIEGEEENTRELFNLANDPHELNNIFNKEPKVVTEMTTLLQKWKDKHITAKIAPAAIPKDDLDKLKSLGYIE